MNYWSVWLDPTVLIPVAMAAVGTVVFLHMRSRRLRSLQSDLEELRARLARAEAQNRDQTRILARMRHEKSTVASLALSLPNVLQALNRGDLDPRQIPPLIISLLEAIFQPGQVLFYATRVAGPDRKGPHELHLVTHYGLPEVPPDLKRIPFGVGKIGWVAAHRVDMLKEDWLNPMRTEGQKILDNHPSLRPDIIGPLVHRAADGEQVLGVLCVGAPGIRPRDEKLMFQTVTNLGSMALVNAHNVTRLRERANTDGLTGLLNKRYFMDELLARAIVAAEREAGPLGLFLFDIDHFKTYNDTNGHPAGDELLRTLARLLQQQVRPGDLCCRYGGEEFVVAMPDTAPDETFQVADRIRAAIEAYDFPHRETQPGGRVTISGGVAAFPQDGTSVYELTNNADVALYESKRHGRNRVSRYRGIDIGSAEDATGFDLVPTADDP